MKKRILSLLIALCLVVGLIPAAAAEDVTSGTWDNISWTIADGVLTISGEGDMAYEIDGDHLYNHLYPYSDETTKIVVEEGVTSLCRGIFSDFRYATEVSLPSTLREIDSTVFFNCYGLNEIIIPANVTELGNSVFANNWDLAVRFTGDAPKMKEYSIVDEEGDWGTLSNFHGTIYYPGNNPTWTEAYLNANYGYGDIVWQPYFTSGTCGENLTWVVTEDGTLTISGEGAMRFSSYDFDSIRPMDDGEDYECLGPWAEYSELVTKIVIENGATSIASNAFSGFTNLERVSIPNSMTEIGDYAFRDCWSLEAVNFPSSLKTIGYDAFGFCFTLTQVTIPEGVIHIDKCAFSSCEGLSYVVLPKSLEILDYGSFDWCPISDVYYCGTEDQWNQLLGDRTIDDIFSSTPDLHFNHMMDTAPGSFYYDAVEWALENGITTGATETTFNPGGQCLRAQVVTFLHRAAENPEPTAINNPFTDVKPTDFFYKPVLWAVEEGITNGVSASEFGSYAVCNRAAVVTFLWRAAGSPEPTSTANPFTDVKTSDFFYKPVLWAIENGITNGISATEFGPTADCNRAQVVTFLYRAYS